MNIKPCSPRLYLSLSEIWERSVRATHNFLSEEDIIQIRTSLIPLYFPAVDLYGCWDNDILTGFIGLSGNKIEMLFVDSEHRAKGYGSALIDFAKTKGAVLVDVNEQNPSACIFYQKKGFQIIGRDETDEAGRPFPILHLSL
ncbi:GNAT family N-acetyltransferase [uncultured Duncaniella sp.]|uniref:GNAT family N-acetyltransferase n=1 Tax=uncultured Duncaniella sp. TaxID=2768039 RepID=UPI0032206BDB